MTLEQFADIDALIAARRYVPRHAAPVPTGDSWWTPTRSAAAVVALFSFCLLLIAATGRGA